jgi:hypothetical protein
MMQRILTIVAFAASVAWPALPAPASDIGGSWSMTPSSVPGKIYLDLTIEEDNGRHSHSGSDYTAASLGLSPQLLGGAGHHVAFTIARDAGSFHCDGWLAGGRGGGSLTFSPSAQFLSRMNELGYDLAPDQQASAAMIDITLPYLDGIVSSGIARPPFDKLVAMRALDIDAQYIASLRQAGTTIESANDLIELSALKVDAAFVKGMAAVGYPHLSPRQLVELRALKIDAGYVRRVQAHGYPHPSIEDLVRLKSMNLI